MTKKIKTKEACLAKAGRGLDVGTAFIYGAQKIGSQVNFTTQRDAFFDIERSEFTEDILKNSKVKYALGEDKIYVVGDDAVKFANIFGRNTRRPMRNGIISPHENEALPLIELIINSVLGKPSLKDEVCYYSVPADPVDADFDVVYHQNIIKNILQKGGYNPKSINEGLAVIFSELADDNFTGMGISFGGGMANICLAIMSVPVFSFSVARAGDWLDAQVAQATNEPLSKVTIFKETFFSLKKPENAMAKMEQALSIYHNALIEYVLAEIKREIIDNTKIPEFEKPISVVIAGGTANPPGFLERFKDILNKINFPLAIGEVRLAPHPLHAVAKGTLIAAIADNKRNYNKRN